MSTFYLLPPRAVLGQRLVAALGIPMTESNSNSAAWMEAAESLGKAVESTGAFVVYRDDLPPGEETALALAAGFGAELGDEVVEITPGEATPRRWRLAAA
jgi:hypothetical protein